MAPFEGSWNALRPPGKVISPLAVLLWPVELDGHFCLSLSLEGWWSVGPKRMMIDRYTVLAGSFCTSNSASLPISET